MAALIDAIDIKRKMFFELDGTPFPCLEVEVNTPTARGWPNTGPPQDAKPAHPRRL